MNKNLLLTVFLLGSTLVYAQTEPSGPSVVLHCQLSLDDILRDQSFDIDDPIAEDARYVVFDIWQHLEEFYAALTAGNNGAIETAIIAIDADKDHAQTLSMNLTMFDADFDLVETEKANH